jgi:glutamyl-tRNA reductase
MILGEAEVQGQVKRAYELALVEGATGPILNRVFRGALAAGKRARSETAITERGVSVPSVAGGLAQRFGGRAIRFEELPEQMERADIVVASTASPHHVIEREELDEVMRARNGRPVLLIDLAVPRDIHPDCRDINGVTLHDMDDLQALVERNAVGREAEAHKAEGILRAELSRFERWLGSQDVVPTIAALRARADEIVSRVVVENEPRWESLSDADRERVKAMARAIAGRLLHEPTLRLKRASGEDDAYLYVSALRDLFGLDADSAPEQDAGGEVRPLREARARKRPAS